MMSDIDVTEIMKHLEEKLKKGLDDETLNITDISRLIGKHLEEAQEKIVKDTADIVNSKMKSDDSELCKNCGETLKKTKKETNP